MNVSIQVLYANEPLQTLHFAAPGALLVGRHVDCDVRLEDSLVSRVHARVDLGAGFFSVEDLSSNGTGLNDGVLHKERQNARYGDCVYIGQFQLDHRSGEAGGGHGRSGGRHASGERSASAAASGCGADGRLASGAHAGTDAIRLPCARRRRSVRRS